MKTEIIKVNEDSPELTDAAEVIKCGGLVVFPTETVYGLGADALNPEAAKKIFKAKGRPSDNPLIVHISDPAEAEKYVYTNEVYYKLAEAFMPGPLTVIMKSKDIVPPETRGGLDTVALRCPENPIARRLISLAGTPIAAPSANLSGSPSPTTAEHVIDDMYGRVDVILDGGPSDFGLESTIVKIEDDQTLMLLRPGKITVEDLMQVVDFVKIANAVKEGLSDGEIALSPGMKYRHYAPKAPLILLDGDKTQILEFLRDNIRQKTAFISYSEDVSFFSSKLSCVEIYDLGASFDYELQAKNLFAVLRAADKNSHTEIYAPLPRAQGVGLALYNRMIRAAAHQIKKL